MALADDFARQFPNQGPSAGLSRGRFWREAVEEGSISRTKTARASEEVKSPSGAVYWVHPGEVRNLKAQGWTQLSSGIPPKTGPSPEERRLAARQADADRRDAAFAAERTAPPIGFERTEAAYTAGGGRARAQAYAAAEAQRAANKLAQDRLAAEELERKAEEAERVQGSIDNAANRPTAAIYARYLAGIMTESQVLRAIRQRIAARLEGIGIDTGTMTDPGGPTVPGTGFVREGTGLWPEGTPPGRVSAESGSALVDRMVDAELKRLREVEFRGFTPQPNQGAGESADTGNAAGYKRWQDRLNTGWHLSETTAVAPQMGYTTLTRWNEAKGEFDSITLESIMVDEIQKLLDVGFKVDTTTQTRPVVDTGTVVDTGGAAAVVDTRTDFERQQDLNKARRDREEARIAAERTPFTGTPGFPGTPGLPVVPDTGATIGPGGLLSRQSLIEEQDDRALFLRGLQEATGRGLGGFIPVAQRAIGRAFSRFGDVSPITNYFPQQERGASWRDYLKGPQPTAESLQTSLGNILGDFANRPSNISPAYAKFSTTFGTPESAISAAAQPYLSRIAPRLRGAAQTGIFNMFGPQFATSPQQYQTPEQIFGVFKDFQSKGF